VFRKEYSALQECENIPFTPNFYESAELLQDRQYAFPGGYLRAIVMSKVPGSVAPNIEDLT
jgi:hypothetical protein